MDAITVIVKPNSSKSEIKLEGGVYRVSIKAAPDKGRANKELVKFLSRHFKKKAEIISGARSKKKLIRLQ